VRTEGLDKFKKKSFTLSGFEPAIFGLYYSPLIITLPRVTTVLLMKILNRNVVETCLLNKCGFAEQSTETKLNSMV
jgi:hypothetical protein